MYKIFALCPRRIIFRILPFLLLLLAAGCGGLPWQQTDTGTQAMPPDSIGEQPSDISVQPVPVRPRVELSQEILYKLLVAEVAGQRGHLDISVRNYLEVAEETRDPEVASSYNFV